MCILQTRGLSGDLKDKVKDTAEGFGDKIKDTANELGDKIEGAANKLGDKIKEAYIEAKSSAFLGKLKIKFGRYWKAIEPRLGDIMQPCAITLVKQFGKVNASVINLNLNMNDE